MQSPVSSISHPASLSTHLDQQQQYILRTPISTPTSRSQPQSPSQFQVIHNKNPFLPDSASPSSPKDCTLPNTPVPKTPLTPPDSSGKSLVDIDIRPEPLGDPINISQSSTNKFTSETEASPRVQNTSDSIPAPIITSLTGSGSSPIRGSTSCSTSPSRDFPYNNPVEAPQARLSDSSASQLHFGGAGFLASQADDVSVGSTESVSPPNVYINGLPPNFPEEQLYNMTKEFGPIISVRTFTRHVSERPTGYGFVLFEALDAAENCIETLRKYRNLHPSLAKVHKIPGTVYANVQGSDDNSSSDQETKDSFKSRMERYKDESSTNLYIEGLPLSIDGPTLAALMSPYKIMSSRLFHTRLSHPPRIIAFVRLETRTAAEEIVERLHGRMVRGWNDPGCRISVRFADTAEQRELRRQERMNQGTDHSPARLTMAQAALLNMQGPQSLPPKQSRHGSRAENNIGKAFNRSPLSHSLPLPLDSTIAYQTSSVPYGRVDEYDNQIARREEEISKTHTNSASSTSATKARNGYTPAEELILAAHAHAQQLHSRGVPGIVGMNTDRISTQPKDFSSYSSHLTSPHISGMPGIDQISHTGLHSIAQDQYAEQQGYPYSDTPDLRSGRDGDGMEKIHLGFDGFSISRSQQQNSRFTTLPSHIGNNRMRQNIIQNSRIHGSYDTYDVNIKHKSGNFSAPTKKNTFKSSININTNRIFNSNLRNMDGNSTGDVSNDNNYNEKEDNGDSPLVSPALTFTSHGRTPQTLSPVTPFFGSFTHGEAFDGPAMGGTTLKGKERAIITAEDC